VIHSLQRLLVLVCFLAGICLLAAEPAVPKADLSEYRTVEKAVAAKIGPGAGRAGQTGYSASRCSATPAATSRLTSATRLAGSEGWPEEG
jgi:hypothetical protein